MRDVLHCPLFFFLNFKINILKLRKLVSLLFQLYFVLLYRRRRFVFLMIQPFLFHFSMTTIFTFTEKKDLIESKKIISLNDFLWFKEIICLNETKFVWFKQNIFGSNKYCFEANKFLPWIKQIISLTIYQCINFFVLKKN